MKNKAFFFTVIAFFVCCVLVTSTYAQNNAGSKHNDLPFIQDYAVKYRYDGSSGVVYSVSADRNKNIKILSKSELLTPVNGEFLWPGQIVRDGSHRFLKTKNILSMTSVQRQFVYLDPLYLFSDAWAGKLYAKHGVHLPQGFAGNENLEFIVFNKNELNGLSFNQLKWKKNIQDDEILKVKFASSNSSVFYVLTTNKLIKGDIKTGQMQNIFSHDGVNDFTEYEKKLVLTEPEKGLIYLNEANEVRKIVDKLPSLKLTSITYLQDKLWVGSAEGAFSLNPDQTISYYAGKRWLVDDYVTQINEGIDNEVLILTQTGLAKIVYKEMTLAEKAEFYDKQVRQRHIRNGFNANTAGLVDGDLSTGYLNDSDNDGLWTSMYLASQAFRYAVTGDEEALQNCRESLDAMERLYAINSVPGFPARSFERTGFAAHLGGSRHWQKSADEDWDWKATTSSDEAIGHIFVYGVIADIVDDRALKNQAIRLIDSLMTHIVENNLYLVDFDEKPTLWGRWNPEYVNGFSKNIGDRKLNSSNIIAMLQTAYHFTKKEMFKDKAYELMEDHGYLENLMRPMEVIGQASDDEDDLSRLLSVYWNHSDDEMYFLGYWGLYRYAFTEDLRTQYKASILDHWEAERSEKEGLWNIMTALTGATEIDLDNAVWYLQKYPLDLINWTVKNSHRKDIEFIEDNFRHQFIKNVLPPDELKISRHNTNRFILDGGNDGMSEYTAGDIWLLPYWMGRYLNVID